MAKSTKPEAQSEVTFEQAFRELEETVRKLEVGGLTLEESLAIFERGTELAQLCSQQLDSAELRVRQLLTTSEDETDAVVFDAWEDGAGSESP